MSQLTCGNCEYFRDAQVLGACRRYPTPQNKHQSDWCGEHKIKMVELPVYDIMTDETTTAKVPEVVKRGRKPKDDSTIA
mgnify:FL=1